MGVGEDAVVLFRPGCTELEDAEIIQSTDMPADRIALATQYPFSAEIQHSSNANTQAYQWTLTTPESWRCTASDGASTAGLAASRKRRPNRECHCTSQVAPRLRRSLLGSELES